MGGEVGRGVAVRGGSRVGNEPERRVTSGVPRVRMPMPSRGFSIALGRGAGRRVHECVFGVLALESEAVDPRL